MDAEQARRQVANLERLARHRQGDDRGRRNGAGRLDQQRDRRLHQRRRRQGRRPVRQGRQHGDRGEGDGGQRQTEQQHAQSFRIKDDLAKEGHLHRTGTVPEQLRQQRQQDTAEDDAGDIAHAAKNDHAQHHHRFHQVERLRTDEALEAGEQGARHTAETGAHGERQQLHVARVDTAGFGRDLVFANGNPGAANARVLQPDRDEDDE